MTKDKVALVEELVLSDQRLKVEEIAEMTKLSDSTVRRILYDHLGMQKVSARWVPKHLSTVQKAEAAPDLGGQAPGGKFRGRQNSYFTDQWTTYHLFSSDHGINNSTSTTISWPYQLDRYPERGMRHAARLLEHLLFARRVGIVQNTRKLRAKF
nr:unnamed protein product [Callosobruchus analis]